MAKIDWTSVTPAVAKVTLGDDAARRSIIIETWDLEAEAQTVAPFRAAQKQFLGRGNLSGVFACSIDQSHATLAAALQFYAGELSRCGQKGTLEIYVATGTLIKYTDVLLKSVKRGGAPGVRWSVNYLFLIGSYNTLTIP